MSSASSIPVIVVGESISSRTRTREMLEHIGHRTIEEAGGAHEALGKLQTRASAVVLCDWAMEPMDGLALLHEVRRMRGAGAIRFLLLTPDGSWGRQTTARIAGADGVLVQPVRLATLKAKLDLVLARGERRPYQRRA